MRSPQTAAKSSPGSLQLEKACTKQQRPRVAKINKYIYIFFLKSKLLGPERAATRVRLCQVLSWTMEHIREEHS